MIAKPKDIIFFFYVTMLSAAAFGYGLSVIPSPIEQKNIKLDHQRITDLEELTYGIEDYYQENEFLPSSLSELSTTYEQYLNDPDTKKPYEYTATEGTKYKLCADFDTDSSKVKSEIDDPYGDDYGYTGKEGRFAHIKGYKCFELEIPESLLYSGKPVPTFTCLGTGCPPPSSMSDLDSPTKYDITPTSTPARATSY